MPDMEFFPQRPESHPTVYAYEFVGVDSHKGYIKVGYTERDVETRIKEQIHTAAVPYRPLAHWSAMKNDGSCFTDHDVHAILKKKGCRQLNAGEDRNEWFKCTLNDIQAAVVSLQTGIDNVENRTQTFSMRPEQELARVLILTFKPAVQTAWREDLMTHVDFEGWQFNGKERFPKEVFE